MKNKKTALKVFLVAQCEWQEWQEFGETLWPTVNFVPHTNVPISFPKPGSKTPINIAYHCACGGKKHDTVEYNDYWKDHSLKKHLLLLFLWYFFCDSFPLNFFVLQTKVIKYFKSTPDVAECSRWAAQCHCDNQKEGNWMQPELKWISCWGGKKNCMWCIFIFLLAQKCCVKGLLHERELQMNFSLR